MANYYESPNKYGRTDRFEIVEKIPDNYKVWNIGADNMGSVEYLPLCEQKQEGDFSVNLKTLKCVKILPSELENLELISMVYGFNCYAACQQFIENAENDGDAMGKKLAAALVARGIYYKYMNK